MRWLSGIAIVLAAASAAGAQVLFAEDFEQFDPKRWSNVKNLEGMEVVDGGVSGKCLRITWTPGKGTGGHLYKLIEPGTDEAYLRFYVKFAADHGYVHHFVHLCAYNPPTRWPQGGAGERPRGDERFTTGIEPWGMWGRHRPPGAWHLYSYWMEMKGGRDGKFWGNSFKPDEPILVERDRWIAVELMIKANSAPDKADGEQAFWIDGRKAGHWKNIRWRRDEALKINGLWMLYYITETAWNQNRVDPPAGPQRIWFDEIVLSRQYIGPIED